MNSESSLWTLHRRLIQGFYWCFVIKIVTLITVSFRLVELSKPVYLWPVEWWAPHLPYATALGLASGLSLLLSLAVAIGYYQRWLRVLHFLAFFEFLAIINSHGQIRHDAYPLLWIDFIFIGLNMTKPDEGFDYRSAFSIFNAAKAYVLMTYALSGFWKALYLIKTFFTIGFAEAGIDLNSPMQKIAYVLARNSSHAWLGIWSLDQPILMFVLWVLTLFLQLNCATIYFFPKWQRLWGVALIAFHVSTFLFFGILFDSEALIVLLFFVMAAPALPATLPAWKRRAITE